MGEEFSDEVTTRIAAFVEDVGIKIRKGTVNAGTFLPGIEVTDGSLVVDESKLLYPGDILHEAGHLAVTPACLRWAMSGEVKLGEVAPQVGEVEAMLWSYAACVHLCLDPRVVFHEHGYHGQSKTLLGNFEMGIFLGVHALEASGMTLSPAAARPLGEEPFPKMRKWLRD